MTFYRISPVPHLTGATDDEDRPEEENSGAFPITVPSCRRGRTNFDDCGRSGNEEEDCVKDGTSDFGSVDSLAGGTGRHLAAVGDINNFISTPKLNHVWFKRGTARPSSDFWTVVQPCTP